MKKLVSLLLVLAMALSLAACGGSSAPAATEAPTAAATEAAPAEMTEAEKAAAEAEIRYALGLLFDRNYIVNDVAQGGQAPASSFVASGMTDADGSEFYKNAGHNDGFVGYFDVSAEAYAANCDEAIKTLKKYYSNITG